MSIAEVSAAWISCRANLRQTKNSRGAAGCLTHPRHELTTGSPNDELFFVARARRALGARLSSLPRFRFFDPFPDGAIGLISWRACASVTAAHFSRKRGYANRTGGSAL